MVKRLFLSLIIVLSLALPVWATQELDGDSDGAIDVALYSAIADLTAESKIGTAAGTVAAGDHGHSTLTTGAASSTTGEIVVFDGTGGKTIKASGLGAGIVKV